MKFRNKKNKSIKSKAGVILILLILLSIVALTGCIESCKFEQELHGDSTNWDIVSIPQCALNLLEDNRVETVFDSIFDDAGVIWIFTEDEIEGMISWSNSRVRVINELTHIYADKDYRVNVEYNCVLRIG